MKSFSYVIAVLLGAVLVLFLQHFFVFRPISHVGNDGGISINYADLVAIILTSVTVVLAAFGIIIAIVAFRSFKEIKNDAIELAKKTVSSTLPNMAAEKVTEEVELRLPSQMEKALQAAIEEAGMTGKLDRALERAILKLGMGENNGEVDKDDK